MAEKINIAKLFNEAQKTKDYFVIKSAITHHIKSDDVDRCGNISKKVLLNRTKGTDAFDALVVLFDSLPQREKGRKSRVSER